MMKKLLVALALLAPGAVGVARAECTVWEGQLTDKWPGAATIKLTICPDAEDADHVTGVIYYNDPDSGWDRRSLEGEWAEDHTHLRLADTTMLEMHPKSGWRLCTADSYELDLSDDELSGTFDSTDCDDDGELSLGLVQPAAVEITAPPAPTSWPLYAAAAAFLACALVLVLRRLSGATIASNL
jgi:hypothetical protein